MAYSPGSLSVFLFATVRIRCSGTVCEVDYLQSLEAVVVAVRKERMEGEQCWLLLLWLLLLLLDISSMSDCAYVSLRGFYSTETRDTGVNL